VSGPGQRRQLPEVVYTPESQLRHPLRLVRSMFRDLLVSRELAWRLLVRNIKAQYRQTALGYLWAFLPPIVTTLSFSFLNSSGVISIQDTSVPYPLYVLTGTVLWQAFADALHGPIRLVTSSREMLAKVNFPREALILAAAGEVLVYTFIRVLLVVAAMLWYGVSLPSTLVLAPVAIFSLIGLGIVIGVLLAPVALLIQDVERGLTMVLTLWFFLTPVVYPVPSTWPASLLATINPVSILLAGARYLFLGGVEVNWLFWLLANAATMSLLFVGWVAYRVAIPHVLARVSA
jgi:lipopolysaccharide transport system permease protein